MSDGAVWVHLASLRPNSAIELALRQLDAAMADFNTPRIARELARLDRAGASPERALTQAIHASYDRLPDGMTHAYAAADAWLRLRDL